MAQNNKTLNKIKVFIINAQFNYLMNELVKKNAYCQRLENICYILSNFYQFFVFNVC